MKYPYTTVAVKDSRGRFLKRPLVEVVLIGKNRSARALALIDSGADGIVLNIEYAKLLEIDLDESRQQLTRGIVGDPTKTYLAPLKYQVDGFDKIIETNASFIDSQNVDILLGQQGFFEFFRVKFEKDHDMFEISINVKINKKLK